MTSMLRGLDINLKGLGITDAECCKKVGGDGRAGSIACCNGKVIPCIWTSSSATPESARMQSRASLVHEQSHVRDSVTRCAPGVVDYAGIPAERYDASECNAYAAEVPWLQRGVDECKTWECRNDLQRQLDWTIHKFMPEFCQLARMKTPIFPDVRSRPPNSGLAPYRPGETPKKQGPIYVQDPLPPPPKPSKGKPVLEYTDLGPTELKYRDPKKAPVIEDPGEAIVSYLKNDPKPRAPTSIDANTGLPSCPAGEQYVMLDGQPSCRNRETGKFTPYGMRGLSGLSAFQTPSLSQVAQIGAPVAAAGVVFAVSRNVLLTLAAGVGTFMITRAITRNPFKYRGTVGPRIPGTNERMVNH